MVMFKGGENHKVLYKDPTFSKELEEGLLSRAHILVTCPQSAADLHGHLQREIPGGGHLREWTQAASEERPELANKHGILVPCHGTNLRCNLHPLSKGRVPSGKKSQLPTALIC